MKRKAALVLLVSLFTLAPIAVSALGLTTIVPWDCNGAGGCQSICDLATLAQNVLDDGIFIAIFLSAILFAWAGWRMVIAQGNPETISQSKKIFWYVTIGLVIIVSAWIIVSVIMSALTNNPNWNALCTQPTSLSRIIPLV